MRQGPGFYRRRVGDAVVTALSDGWLDGSTDIVVGIDEAEKASVMGRHFRNVGPLRLALNSFLIAREGRLALVDAGGGPNFNPATGKVAGNLAAAGHAPGEIDTVLITHLHPDHVLGLLDDAGGARYPNATLRMHAAEHAHWHSDAAKAATPEPFQPFFDVARNVCAAYARRVSLHEDGEVFPGVSAVPLPGHTPGHSGYRVAGEEDLLIWGDIFHIPELQARHPDTRIVFDVDPERAAATRGATLRSAADKRLLVAGMHLCFPAFSHVREESAGYALVPELWLADLV
jgi:glyoxylase-like metal-dependent hydrolase (beta-lactamase superfamily II)